MRIHDGFDLHHWTTQFQLEALRARAREFVLKRRDELPSEYPSEAHVDRHIKLMEPRGEILVGPGSLAVNEQLRAEAFAGNHYRGSRVATDVFVWARGEAPNPAMTKMGGVPYRPRSLPWPRDGQGKPIRFIAQLCFADSRDIVGDDLPGDVLLIFGDDDALLAEPERLVFEWSRLGIEGFILDIPQMGAELLTPSYGVIHRTEDWPDAVEEIDGRYGSPWLLRAFEGTKIGGVPRYIQREPTRTGRFLAALGSISVDYSSYPLINQREACGPPRGDNDLMIGDMGSLYLFLDRGRVLAESQCY